MRPITFLSDYGYRDEFAGVCRGVIERIAPGAHVIDLSHGIPAGDVQAGALALRRALPYMPADAVHLAIVDPSVGSERRALALRCGNGAMLVGPDNGLLWPASELCGGIERVLDLTDSPHGLQPRSATFHGRDLFAPIAARLANDMPIEFVGQPIDPDSVERLELPHAEVRDGRLATHVLTVDVFGNLQLDAEPSQLQAIGVDAGESVEIESAGSVRKILVAEKFADAQPGEALIYVDSTGSLAIAVNRGSAADELGLEAGAELSISRILVSR
jgi:S-adenosylmethionine hydrolase